MTLAQHGKKLSEGSIGLQPVHFVALAQVAADRVEGVPTIAPFPHKRSNRLQFESLFIGRFGPLGEHAEHPRALGGEFGPQDHAIAFRLGHHLVVTQGLARPQLGRSKAGSATEETSDVIQSHDSFHCGRIPRWVSTTSWFFSA